MEAYFLRMVGPQNVAVSLFFGDKTDYFPNIPKGLVQRPSLAIATFEERALDHIESVLVFFNENGNLRIPSFRLRRHVRSSHRFNRTTLHRRNQTAEPCGFAILLEPVRGIDTTLAGAAAVAYSLTFSTARKASCGISTRPTRFMRLLPSFCFSSNLRLRVTSPP